MNQKPIVNQSLTDKADERDRSAAGRWMAGISNALVGVGLLISAVLTIIYLMLLVQEATGLPDPYGYLFGLLVGVVAIVPAELAMVIWKSRLDSDATITKEQRVAAVTALILAGIFSSLTTGSFFSYSLPQLFPPNYLEIAPTMNIIAIVGSWIVFLMAVVAYSISSRQTQQNLAQAKAQQGVFDARMSVIRSAGEAIRAEADSWIDRMDENGVFGEDAKRLIANVLNMEDERLSLPAPVKGRRPNPNGREKVEQTTPPGPSAFEVYRKLPGGSDHVAADNLADRQTAETFIREDSRSVRSGTRYAIKQDGRIVSTYEKTGREISQLDNGRPTHPQRFE